MKLSQILLPYLLVQSLVVSSQNVENGKGNNLPNREAYILPIKKTQGQIRIDGVKDEPGWKFAFVAKDFRRITPIDTGFATTKTEVSLLYDDKMLYVLAKCYEDLPGDNIIESLRRDFSFMKNDGFFLYLDTFNDQTNGFSFGLSAGGVKYDGLQVDGGNVSMEWDCKWESAVKHYDKYWIVEMAIPFRNLKFQPEVKEWGINFTRMDLKRFEKSSWAPIPRQFRSSTLAFTGTLLWETPPPKPKINVSLIPYVSASYSEYFENNQDGQFGGNAGIDLKASLSPTLNMDVTINPDYSQVDVDEQITNLDRFELFFPERRKFFLENEDLFAGYGKDGIRPFFSRRIGLESPVLAGVRLSGKLDENWRLGFLNMQTKTEMNIPAANYTVASLQRRVFSRSSIGAFFVNKNITSPETDTSIYLAPYNRVMGVDFNLASSDNRWTGKTFFHKSITPNNDKKGYSFSTMLRYATQQAKFEWVYDRVGKDYRAETGFVRRTGFQRINPSVGYKFFPKSDQIISHGPSLQTEFILDPHFKQTDRGIILAYSVEFLNTRAIVLSYKRQYIMLLEPFDPTNSGGDTLAAGTDYDWNSSEVKYQSDARKKFNYSFGASYGGYFNGSRLNLSGQINYRFQPYGSISFNMTYDNLKFPEPYKDADFLLIGLKADVTFTNKLFLTTFLQYNEQMDNFNTNIRLQWRYKPVSDLFIVFSDNYIPNGLNVKTRSVVVKLSYWFN
ncbi:MAG: carbohydrate binding family 9 domain-containing protein [Bacteroidales bacterium]|nr:carbohydrate binding family 9 domain-containing protein [Bacteroidales bacterium]